MKDRLVTLGLALAALILFYAFFVPKPSPREQRALPTSHETNDDGYRAAWLWLERQNIPVKSLRQQYTKLDASTASQGNLLITTLPHRVRAGAAEIDALDRWVRRGNTLLVMAALDDTPEWSLGAGNEFFAELRHMTRLEFEVSKEPVSSSKREHSDMAGAFSKLLQSERSVLVPKGHHPLFAGVQSLLAISDFPASHFIARRTDMSALLEIAQRSADARSQPAMWLERAGEGQIIVCSFASLFSNRLMGERDNAKLFANIIAWSRSEQGLVLFDDAHQGMVDYYDAQAFFADSRLHRALAWIVFLWLVFVVGWQPLRARQDSWRPTDVTQLIEISAGFFANKVAPAIAAKRLFENFFNGLRRRLGLQQDGTPVWDWLGAHARVDARALAELERFYGHAQAGSRIDLVRLQTLLADFTRKLA